MRSVTATGKRKPPSSSTPFRETERVSKIETERFSKWINEQLSTEYLKGNFLGKGIINEVPFSP